MDDPSIVHEKDDNSSPAEDIDGKTEIHPVCEEPETSSALFYRALLDEYEIAKDELHKLREENRQIIEDKDAILQRHQSQIDDRDRQIASLVKEKCDIQNSEIRVRSELKQQVDVLKRHLAAATKEKEAIVVKYAQREHGALKLELQIETLEKRLADSSRERDSLLMKIKNLNGDKSLTCQLIDQKCAELLAVRRDLATVKDELSSRDNRLKMSEAKLKEERDANREMKSRLELLSHRIKEQKDDFDLKIKDMQEVLKNYKSAEENKTVMAEEERIEHQAKVIVENQYKQNELSQYKLLLKSFESLKEQENARTEELKLVRSQVENSKDECQKLTNTIVSLNEEITQINLKNSGLRNELQKMESVKLELEKEKERANDLEADIKNLNEIIQHLREELAVSCDREAEALAFSEKLTEANVELRSTLTVTEGKVQQMVSEHDAIMEKAHCLEKDLVSYKNQLEEETSKRLEETQILAVKLAEKTLQLDSKKKEIDELKGEIAIIKKKQSASIKEMGKELNRLRRRGEHTESIHSNGEVVSLGSRTSSTGSLNTTGLSIEVPRQSSPSPLSLNGVAPEENGHIMNFDDLEDKQQFFIDKILKLQRGNARKTEKVEFLEEHVKSLTEEIKKKNKILTSYFLKEEAGGLSSERSDKVKLSQAKKLAAIEMAKHGGVMASLYSSRVTDNSMSLELSLEINRKLQALLEDTLLKNITLKESLNTLGEEVARVSQDYQKLLKAKS
ncbi:coiled-coil domain-containing protein 186-like isoform X1 [Artemia franciscana]|uniref:coiled-coil domain-containing protein 186-like isoform X1 n=1 Tax=Artemia franciscana TaxID=6661 RepID=UPI0032DB309B